MRARNPSGILGTGVSLTDLVLIGGAAWLLLSDQGRALLGLLFPDKPLLSSPPGFGSSTGQVIDPNTGQIRTIIPRTPEFRIVHVDTGNFLIRRGDVIEARVRFEYRGPAGAFVAGINIAHGHLGCILNVHNDPFQTVEDDVYVSDEPNWRVYETTVRGNYQGPGLTDLDAQIYIRDASGQMLAHRWQCAAWRVVPF